MQDPDFPDSWQMQMARKLRLEFALHPRGRPRNEVGRGRRKGLRPLFCALSLMGLEVQRVGRCLPRLWECARRFGPVRTC